MPLPKLVATAVMMAAQIALTAMQTTEGPRLTDTKATVADYGTPCNNFIGTRLLPAHCIFAKDIEEKKKKRKGKAGKQVSYTGFGTWCAQIAEHPIDDVLEVWFDNHLVYEKTPSGVKIYPLADDYELESSMRFMLGGPDQEPDPDMLAFIEARDGPGTCPAYKYGANIYFERVPLEQVGNRRPDVKVLAQRGGVNIGPVITEGVTVELRYLQGYTEHTDTEYGGPENYDYNLSADAGFDWLDENGDYLDYGIDVARDIRAPWTEVTMSAVAPAGAGGIKVWFEVAGLADTPPGVGRGAIDGIEVTVDGQPIPLTNSGGDFGVFGWDVSTSGGLVGGGVSTQSTDPAAPEGAGYFVGAGTLLGSFGYAEQTYAGAVGVDVTLGDLLTMTARRARLDDDEFDFSQATQIIPGYSWTQGTGQQICEAVCDIYDTDVRPHDFIIEALPRGMEPIGEIDTAEFVQDEKAPYKLDPTADEDLPRRVFLTFADLDHGQEPNTAMPLGGPDLGESESAGEVSLDLQTLALEAADAQAKVEVRQRRVRFARTSGEFALTRRRIQLEPGDVYTPVFDGNPLTMRNLKATIGADGVIATEWERDDPLLASSPESLGAPFAGYVPPTVPTSVETIGTVLDVPLLMDAHDQTAPLAYLVAGPEDPGVWMGAEYAVSDTGELDSFTEGWDGIASGDGAVIGTCVAALPEALPWLPDYGSTLTIDINAGELTGATIDELLAEPTRNLAAVRSGDAWELVQFTTATLTGELQYELAGFLRGLRGTEHAIAGHAPGDAFYLLDGTAKLKTIGAGEIGDTDSYVVSTVGQAVDQDEAFELEYTAVSHRPYAPVAGSLTFDVGTGDCAIDATRRTRVGGATLNGQDVPLGESAEAWQADVFDGATYKRTIAGVSLPLTYTAAQQTTDFGAPLTTGFTVNLYQMSPALSLRGYPLEITP